VCLGPWQPGRTVAPRLQRGLAQDGSSALHHGLDDEVPVQAKVAHFALGDRVERPLRGPPRTTLGTMLAWPLALLGIGLARHEPFTTTAALSWIAHIALDHALGYGVKLPSSFEHTVLGPIGRSRRW